MSGIKVFPRKAMLAMVFVLPMVFSLTACQAFLRDRCEEMHDYYERKACLEETRKAEREYEKMQEKDDKPIKLKK